MQAEEPCFANYRRCVKYFLEQHIKMKSYENEEKSRLNLEILTSRSSLIFVKLG